MKKIHNTAVQQAFGTKTMKEEAEELLPIHRKPANQEYKRWLQHHLPEMNPADIITMYDVRTMM